MHWCYLSVLQKVKNQTVQAIRHEISMFLSLTMFQEDLVRCWWRFEPVLSGFAGERTLGQRILPVGKWRCSFKDSKPIIHFNTEPKDCQLFLKSHW